MSQATLLFSDAEGGGYSLEIQMEDEGVFQASRPLTEAESAALQVFEAQSGFLTDALKTKH